MAKIQKYTKEAMQEAASRRAQKRYFDRNPTLQNALTKAKPVPTNVIKPPATLLPSGTPQLPHFAPGMSTADKLKLMLKTMAGPIA